MHRALAHEPRAGLGLTPYGRGLIEALGAGHGYVCEGRRQRHHRRAAEKASPAPTGATPASSMHWLEKAEAMGELKRITAEVSPDLEAAHITYLVGLEKSPALLFENIKGHPGHKALYNMIGCNLSRFCLMIGEEPVDIR